MSSLRFLSAFFVLGCAHTASAQVSLNSYANFEGAQTNPVRLSSDGTMLYAVNTADNRLSVFSLSNPSSPALIAEIPVGLEPVSVNPRTLNEVWVVNQASDSISIVSTSRRIVTDTILVKDEPADIVFAGGYAFVTEARSNQVAVINVSNHSVVTNIPLMGAIPRALAVSPDGTRVYAAFALAGTRTTIIPTSVAPPPPPPTNPALPPAPLQGIIVDATDPAWNSSYIKFTMPANGVVEIDARSLTITRYFSMVGSQNLGIAVNPANNDIWVANTNAKNLVRFEPSLNGHFVDNRMSRISYSSGAVSAFDLNPGIDYTLLPNPTALGIALAQPTAAVFDPSGSFMWVAAFGTDRIAKVSARNGAVLSRIEVSNATGSTSDPVNKRGPRGLALLAAANKLYVLNRISNTLSVIDTNGLAVIAELDTGSFDPTPTVIKQGRGFLYDAKLSGNGTGSCAACHLDAEMDTLAWDLGDPNGDMTTVYQGNRSFALHPMKGPMVTLTLRGLNGLAPYHWRGDRANFQAFNQAFQSLMGGTQLSGSNMDAYTNFINTVLYMPNPNENLDRSMPLSFGGGNPQRGQPVFMDVRSKGVTSCNTCHTSNPGPGTNLAIDSASFLGAGEQQAFKVSQLRNMYQKLMFNHNEGAQSIAGFGMQHEGSAQTVSEFITMMGFTLDSQQMADVDAYEQCYDTGTAPAVGYAVTLSSPYLASAGRNNDWNTLQSRASAGDIDLIAKGTINGMIHGLLYQPLSATYRTDQTGLGPYTQAQLQALLTGSDVLTFMGVYPGTGYRMGIDRNNDGVLDGDSGGSFSTAMTMRPK